MKKCAICIVGALAVSLAATADVMMWQVPTSGASGSQINGSSDIENWTYAVLRATTAGTSGEAIYGGTGGITEDADSNPILSSYVDSSGTAYKAVDRTMFDTAKVVAELPSAYQDSAYNFYVELYDSNNTLVGFSNAVNYDNLSQYIASSVEQATQLGMYNGGWSADSSGYTSVPEPTSGVMLLLGAALLGLRRRRMA